MTRAKILLVSAVSAMTVLSGCSQVEEITNEGGDTTCGDFVGFDQAKQNETIMARPGQAKPGQARPGQATAGHRGPQQATKGSQQTIEGPQQATEGPQQATKGPQQATEAHSRPQRPTAGPQQATQMRKNGARYAKMSQIRKNEPDA